MSVDEISSKGIGAAEVLLDGLGRSEGLVVKLAKQVVTLTRR